MTASQLAAIRELRSEGWAVILWTPEELNGVDPSDVEDQSVSFAAEYLIPAGTDEDQFYGPSARI